MSQFLAVVGAGEAAAAIYARGLEGFAGLCGLRPAEACAAGEFRAALFPRLLSGPAGLLREDAGSGSRLLAAGTWFYEDEGAEAGAPRLGADWSRLPEGLRNLATRLDGMFVLLTFDPRTGTLRAATDRLGTLHVYAAQLGGCLVLSTSSLTLAWLQGGEWDLEGCREFLATGTVFETKSLFRRIEKLEPATVFTFQKGRPVEKTRYWSVAGYRYGKLRPEEIAGALGEEIKRSVRQVCRAYRAPVFDLTGGIDSRILVAAARRGGCGFATVVNGQTDDADVRAAGEIARRFGLDHRHQIPAGAAGLWRRAKNALGLCDGEYDVLEYAAIADVHRRLVGAFDVSVNGSNGEIAKGYWWELLFPHAGTPDFDERLVAARRFATGQGVAGLLEEPFSEDLVEHFAGIIRRANTALRGWPNTAQMDNVYLTLRMQRWQGRLASSTDRLWPCAAPFTFQGPMAVALSAAPEVRVRERLSRRVMESLDTEMAWMPGAHGYPLVRVRPQTALRFWRLPVEMAGKAWEKAWRRVAAPPAELKGTGDLVRTLWGEEEAREFLNPRSMVTAELYARERLEAFLLESQGAAFRRPLELGRVLTLEMLGRAVRSGSDKEGIAHEQVQAGGC